MLLLLTIVLVDLTGCTLKVLHDHRGRHTTRRTTFSLSGSYCCLALWPAQGPMIMTSAFGSTHATHIRTQWHRKGLEMINCMIDGQTIAVAEAVLRLPSSDEGFCAAAGVGFVYNEEQTIKGRKMHNKKATSSSFLFLSSYHQWFRCSIKFSPLDRRRSCVVRRCNGDGWNEASE